MGDHRRADGTGIRRCAPTAPEAVPTTVPPLSTWAVTVPPPTPWATRSSTPAGTSGVVSSRVTRAAWVGSSQTVCQMPLAAV